MLKIAICDDDTRELANTAALLRQYRGEEHQDMACDVYQSPLELIAAVQRGQRYDLILLDIIMPGENGIDAAREIRETDGCVRIVFLTSSPEFAVQSYAVNAHHYLLKPLQRDSFFRLLREMCAEIEKPDDSLILNCRTGVTRIPLSRLEYCEVIGRSLCFHMTSGQVLESVGSMEKISERLTRRGGFFRAHRSYTVNLDYVDHIAYHAVTLRCLAEIPLPRGKFAEIKDAFLARAFEKGWDEA